MSETGLKLLLVLDGLWVGGTERSVAELLPHLVEGGISPIVACLRRREEGVEREVVEAGFDVRFLPASRLPGQVLALRRLIRSEEPAIVHSALFRANLVTRFAAIGSGVVVINSLVNTPYEPVRFEDPAVRPVALRLVKWLDGWTGRWLVDHFHSVSEAAAQAAVQRLGYRPERITVVHRGRDPERLGKPSAERKRRAREMLGLPDDAQVLVHVGRQDFQKGLTYLLEAIALLAPSHPRLLLLQAGRPGSATRELEKLVPELGLGDRVRFLGHRPDVYEVLAAGDIFVFPSLFEGLPGTVIEAMALGLPIVAFDIPSVREVVDRDRNARLVPVASPSRFAQSIDSMLTEFENISGFGAHSRLLFERRFAIRRSVEEMLLLYRGLVSAEPGT